MIGMVDLKRVKSAIEAAAGLIVQASFEDDEGTRC